MIGHGLATELPASAVIVFNIVKRRNIGRLIRTADAFGVSDIVIIGRRQFSTHGHFGTDDPRRRQHFFRLADGVAELRARGYRILGVEIADNAVPVDHVPFSGSTAFMFGNEGTGIDPAHRIHCDGFVYVRQYGCGASLNVNVAAGIVLHQFALWAGFQERSRHGEKFTGPEGVVRRGNWDPSGRDADT